MKRSVQILLIVSFLLPLLSLAREETMEERKKRITRKYLRARANIVQGDAEVPFDEPGDESVADSEQFKLPQVDLQRQEPRAQMLPPPSRPRPPAEDRNWLLAPDPMLDDPYADPYADPKKTPKKQADWSAWGGEPDSSPYEGVQRDSWYERRSQEPELLQIQKNDPRRRRILNPREPRASSSNRNQPGVRQQGSSGYDTGALDLSRDKTFNSTLNPGRLKIPFQRHSAPSDGRSFGSGSRLKSQGYIPYKNPYQAQYEKREQQWGGSRQPEQEYKTPDSFQKWKDKNPSRFDPTRDDAYIDELMPNSGR